MLLALAGKYAIASEICRRGFLARVTYDRRKSARIIAENPKNRKVVLVEVRTKQKGEWPKVQGIKGPDRVQVFVDYEGKMEDERPDFYIVDENFCGSMSSGLRRSAEIRSISRKRGE